MNAARACVTKFLVPLTVRRLLPLLALFAPLPCLLAQSPEVIQRHQNGLGMTFVAVPGAHPLFATHETRVSDWDAFVKGSGYTWTYKPHFAQTGDHPVVGINLQDARAFCSWLTESERAAGKLKPGQTYRLPTPAEWDAAVGLLGTRRPDLTMEERAEDNRTHPWGLAWPPPAGAGNYEAARIPGYQDEHPYTAPVGSYKPSAEGLYDLGGNVWEWCWDAEVRAVQTGVLRGGSWAYFRQECLTSVYAYSVPAELRAPTTGFRCVMEDGQRTSVLLAAEATEKQRIRDQRRMEFSGAAVDPKEVAAMRERLTRPAPADAAAPAQGTSTPPATGTAAAPGRPFQNALGMEFLPTSAGPRLLAGRTEVRVQDYEVWLKESSHPWPARPAFLLGGTHPAAGVPWEDATAFCDWLTRRDRAARLISAQASYRLPTDVEWSRLAGLAAETGDTPEQRGQNATAQFPWSITGAFPPPAMTTNLDAANIPGYSDAAPYTAPVTMESRSLEGLLGLSGNVAEWCADPWPSAADERVVRGGSWKTSQRDALRTGARRHEPANSAPPDVGFRLLLDLGPATP